MWPLLAALGAAAASVFAFGGPRAGSRTVAVLTNDKAVNVVFDGKLWRPLGSADFATVKEWADSGSKMADINGSTLTWDGIGFA